MPIMTAVFDVPDDVWKNNPFHIETPFGLPTAVARGDLVAERNEIDTALDKRGLFLFAHIDGTFTVQDK